MANPVSVPVKSSNWCFTFNNWQDHEERHARFQDFDFDENVRYVAFSYEVAPTTGTPHLQGVVALWTDRTKDWVIQEFPAGIHWEKMRGHFTQARNYCGKDDNQIFEFGEAPAQGRRSDIVGFQREIEAGKTFWQVARQENHSGTAARFQKFFTTYADVVEREREHAELLQDYDGFVPREWQQRCLDIIAGGVVPRKIHWVWETIGNAGKSYFARYLAAVHGAALLTVGRMEDIAHAYNKERIVVFNIRRDDDFSGIYRILETLKDGQIFASKYESRVKIFKSPHVFVFANDAPDQRKMSADRWDIVHI